MLKIIAKVAAYSVKKEVEDAVISVATENIDKARHDRKVGENIGVDKESSSILEAGSRLASNLAREVVDTVKSVMRLTTGYSLKKDVDENHEKKSVSSLGIKA